MLDARKKENILIVLLAAAIASAVFAKWGSFVQPQHQQTVNQGDRGAEPHATEPAVPESAEDRIADYTWWLGTFTCALVLVSTVQIGFLIRADKTARISANAAKTSADAAVGVELPMFINTAVTITRDRVGHFLTFENKGRTPAIITADCLVVTTYAVEPPPQPRYPTANVQLHGIDKICATGESLTISRKEQVGSAAWSMAFGYETMLWAYGYFEYVDFMKAKRREGFCFFFLPEPHLLYPTMPPSSGTWYRDTRPAYTYTEIRRD